MKALIPFVIMLFIIKLVWLFAGWLALPIGMYKLGTPIVFAVFFGLLAWGAGVILMKRYSDA